jgi:hypothetical protein
MAKFLKFKLYAKFGKNRLFIVAHHFEAAALRQAVVCKSETLQYIKDCPQQFAGFLGSILAFRNFEAG